MAGGGRGRSGDGWAGLSAKGGMLEWSLDMASSCKAGYCVQGQPVRASCPLFPQFHGDDLGCQVVVAVEIEKANRNLLEMKDLLGIGVTVARLTLDQLV